MASTLFLKEPLPYCLLHYSTPFTCSALIYPISWDLALLLKAQLKNNKNKVQRDLLLLALMSATVWIAGELVSAVLQHIMGKVCQELLQLKQNKPYTFQKIIYDFMQRQAHTDERPLAQNPDFLPPLKRTSFFDNTGIHRDLHHTMLKRLQLPT